ncbi:MAG: hypothetical protein M3349_09570 [Actinomycetota bacterium]|nr:hypothetical protein [Actinomycetota bacterium]
MRRLMMLLMVALVLPAIPQAAADTAPNGQIVFDEDVCCAYDIWVVNADGTGLTNLTNTPDIGEFDPTWSPDGTRISFNRSDDFISGDIWVMDADGSNQVNLTNSVDNEFQADWSPDGSQLVFVREVPGQAISIQFDIFTMNADGTNQVNITNADTGELEPAWSPLGDRIAFAAVRNGDWEIVTTDTAGGGEVTLTVTTQEDRAPDWSPTGTMIVWMSQFDDPCCGDWEIWAVNADGTGATNLTQNPAGDWFPSWSPDGTLILFESFRDGNIFGALFTIDAPTVLPPPGAVALDVAAAEATKLNIGANASSADWGAESGGQVDPVLTVTKTGTGTGTVTSNPAGVNCGTDCSEAYTSGTSVTLTAAPAVGSTFAGWSGACTGTGSCVVTMDAAKSVTATFNTSGGSTFTMTVTKAGTGSGTVTSSPAGIKCGADCTEPYTSGTSVTLTAKAARGSTFTGWSGACTGTGSCVVSMTATHTVTATFTASTATEGGLTGSPLATRQ